MSEPLLQPERVAWSWRGPRLLSWPGLFPVVGALLLLGWAVVTAWPGPIVSTDVEQQRLDRALPPPSDGTLISQTFQARHDGLREVEVILARSGSGAGREGEFSLQLFDEAGALVAEGRWPVASLVHNQTLLLRFPAQPGSQGQRYRLTLGGTGDNPFAAWAYSMDVYDGGELQGDVSDAEELRFVTRYQLQPVPALLALGRLAREGGEVLLLSLLVILMPGCLLLLLAARRLPRLDGAAWWGLALALGAVVWPLLWFWPTFVGLHWSRRSLALLLVLGWAAVAYLALARRRAQPDAGPDRRPADAVTVRPGDADRGQRRRKAAPLLLLALLVLGLALRLLAVRDLQFPPWVDSSRHALITALMAQEGQVPDDYGSYLPVEQFPYHFGFHSISATVLTLTGWSLPSTLLYLGQLLNGLVALTIYAAIWLLARRRSAALLGAFLVALPFFFPAYYATWGRFTQLAGVLVLPVLLALTWLIVRGGRSSRGWRDAWWLVGLLAAGLALIHFRVFLLYVPFAILVLLLGWRRARPLLAAAVLGLVLAGPRLLQLARMTDGSGILSEASEGYARFPVDYVQSGWENVFLILGGVAFVVAVVAALRRQRWALLPVVLTGWAALVVLLLSGNLPGVPTVWLINLNSAYIVFFVPLALLLVLVFTRLWGLLRRRGAVWQALAGLVLGAALAAATLFGARQQVDILNRATILTRPGDEEGLAWADAHLPPDAYVAVNSWQWLGQTWAGSDGGAWLLPLTGRASTTPPADYASDRTLFQDVMQFNQKVTAVSDWSDPQAAEWLRSRGVTHIFVGARGGFFDPAALARNPELTMLYGEQGVFVFSLP